jgi:F-type H+-transporting ATPase subunit delta
MLNPAFDQEVKISVLKAFLEKIQANGPAVKFLEYLVRKNRCGYLEEISRSFSIMMDEFLKIIRIPISTARELSREEQETLRQHLEAATGRKVEMQWSVNPSLIGGMVVRIGEAVVDGSILGQLQAIRRSLIKTA